MKELIVDYVCPQVEVLPVELNSVIAQSDGTEDSMSSSLQGFVINEEIVF